MKTIHTLIIGLVAFGFAAIATPVEARNRHDYRHHRGGHYYHGRWIIERPHSYNRPYYYGYDDCRRPAYYAYGWPYRPYHYYGPGITFSFGSYGHHPRHWR